MKNDKHIQVLMDFLESEDYQRNPESLNEFLEQHPGCREAWEELRPGWSVLEQHELSAPPIGGSWEAVMKAYKAESRPARTITFTLPRWTIAAACGILGLAIGLLWPRSQPIDQSMTAMIEELRQNQLAMQVLLLQSPNASQRMKAVSMTREFPPEGDTRSAWVKALQEDPSINVRMAALDVLTRKDNEETRSLLLEAMSHQESPMMRMAMADLMLEWRVSESVPIIRNWLEEATTPGPLKLQLRNIFEELTNNKQI